jgi:hypothetical protein
MIGVCETNGKGLWSPISRKVPIQKLVVRLGADMQGNYPAASIFDAKYGELCAYFNREDWEVSVHGLIYTDPQWMEQFQKMLYKHGFSVKAIHDVSYSEQGMQGDDYVSMDVGKAFLSECDKLLSFVNGQVKTIEVEVEY